MMTTRLVEIPGTDAKFLQSVRTVDLVGITVGYDFQYFLFAQHILFCQQRYELFLSPERRASPYAYL